MISYYQLRHISISSNSLHPTQKPAVLVRAVARTVQSAKPMAVARGMPIPARQPASAKSKISAKALPAPRMVGRNVGQKVKVKPQTPPATQKLPAKLPNMTNNKEVSVMSVTVTTLLNEILDISRVVPFSF